MRRTNGNVDSKPNTPMPTFWKTKSPKPSLLGFPLLFQSPNTWKIKKKSLETFFQPCTPFVKKKTRENFETKQRAQWERKSQNRMQLQQVTHVFITAKCSSLNYWKHSTTVFSLWCSSPSQRSQNCICVCTLKTKIFFPLLPFFSGHLRRARSWPNRNLPRR